MNNNPDNLNYLRLLSKQYPSLQHVATSIIQLEAQLNLPKGTEHFVSDVHGEHEAFRHVLKNSSGLIKRRINELFPHTLSDKEKRNLATLIYYPEEKLPLILKTVEDQAQFLQKTLFYLIQICRSISSKYLRSTIRGYFPKNLTNILNELLHEQESAPDKKEYYRVLLETIVSTQSAKTIIIALAEIIQKLAIAQLHIVGDIYDRGPGAHLIMDTLLDYHSVDIQWGNHDILWMGAAAGSDACIANVIRICLRYGNTETLENGYGISLMPLVSFATELYEHDPCHLFRQKRPDSSLTDHEGSIIAKMHKAISIIQFKLEAQIIKRRPHYRMEKRLLLDKIDFNKNSILIDQNDYPLLDTSFPTIDPKAPFDLSESEQQLVERMRMSFLNSPKLHTHVRFLFSHGSMYLVMNGNLLYHGCIPMNDDGAFVPYVVGKNQYVGRSLLDREERLARQGYFSNDALQKSVGQDEIWYLWSGDQSPLFGKDKMATFERYFLENPETHKEKRNPYYTLREKEEIAVKILKEFGADHEKGKIINGHVPVKAKKGEKPVKAGGKLIVIDGGFSKAYQKQTGIAGYTLIFNSYGLLLGTHHTFESAQKGIEEDMDMDTETEILEHSGTRIMIKDTDQGRKIKQQLKDLEELRMGYSEGIIKERTVQ